MEEVQDNSESEKRVRCMDETTVFIVHDGENCLAPGVAVDGAAMYRGTIHTVLRTLYPAATDEEVERARPLVSWSIMPHVGEKNQYHYEERTLEALRICGARVVRAGRKSGAVDTAVREELRYISDLLPLFSKDVQRRTAVVLISGDRDFASDIRRLMRCAQHAPRVLLLHGTNVTPAFRAQVPKGCSLPIWPQLVRDAMTDSASESDEEAEDGHDDSSEDDDALAVPTVTVRAAMPKNIPWSAYRWLRWEVRDRIKGFFDAKPQVSAENAQVEVEHVPVEHADAVRDVTQRFLDSIEGTRHWMFVEPSVMDKEMTQIGWDCNAHVQVLPALAISCRVRNCSSTEEVEKRCAKLGIVVDNVQLRGPRFTVKLSKHGGVTAAEAVEMMAQSGEFQQCRVSEAPVVIWAPDDECSKNAVSNTLLPKLQSAQRVTEGMIVRMGGATQPSSVQHLATKFGVKIISLSPQESLSVLTVVVCGSPMEVEGFVHTVRRLARPQQGMWAKDMKF